MDNLEHSITAIYRGADSDPKEHRWSKVRNLTNATDDLQTALDQFTAIAANLNGGAVSGESHPA